MEDTAPRADALRHVELTIFDAGESFRSDWKDILGLMETGKLDVKPLITHILPLSDADRALRIMTDRNEFSVKVMLDCGGETK